MHSPRMKTQHICSSRGEAGSVSVQVQAFEGHLLPVPPSLSHPSLYVSGVHALICLVLHTSRIHLQPSHPLYMRMIGAAKRSGICLQSGCCRWQAQVKSKYNEGESAGDSHIHVSLFQREGGRKLEREWSRRLPNRRLKAGASDAMYGVFRCVKRV